MERRKIIQIHSSIAVLSCTILLITGACIHGDPVSRECGIQGKPPIRDWVFGGILVHLVSALAYLASPFSCHTLQLGKYRFENHFYLGANWIFLVGGTIWTAFGFESILGFGSDCINVNPKLWIIALTYLFFWTATVPITALTLFIMRTWELNDPMPNAASDV